MKYSLGSTRKNAFATETPAKLPHNGIGKYRIASGEGAVPSRQPHSRI
jgi:hypothetical protein